MDAQARPTAGDARAFSQAALSLLEEHPKVKGVDQCARQVLEMVHPLRVEPHSYPQLMRCVAEGMLHLLRQPHLLGYEKSMVIDALVSTLLADIADVHARAEFCRLYDASGARMLHEWTRLGKDSHTFVSRPKTKVSLETLLSSVTRVLSAPITASKLVHAMALGTSLVQQMGLQTGAERRQLLDDTIIHVITTAVDDESTRSTRAPRYSFSTRLWVASLSTSVYASGKT